MTVRTSRVAAWLALATVLSLLGGCGGGPSRTDAALTGTIVPTPTTVPAPAATAVPGPVTTTTRPPAAGSPAGPVDIGGGANTGDPSPATGLAPPAAGRYQYDTTGTSTFAITTVPYPAVSTLVVDLPAGTRQHSTRNLRNADGTGPVIDFSLDYRPDGIYLEGMKLAIGFGTVPPQGQDLRPASPQLLVPTDAAPGTRLEYDLPAGAANAHLVIDIGGHEPVDVGGRGVDAVAVHMTATLPAGAITGSVALDAWLAPSVSLWVQERLTLDAAAAGGGLTFHSQYEATLQRLPG